MAATDVTTIPTEASIYEEYIAELEAQQAAANASIRRQQAMQEAAIQKQVDLLVSQIEANRPKYQQEYENNAQMAYIQNMLAKRDLPQQLAALGITGGLSESSLLGLDAEYGNALTGYKRDFDNQMTGLDQQIAEARMQGEISAAQAAMEYQQMLADAQESYANSIAEAKLSAALDARDQAQQQALLTAQQQAAIQPTVQPDYSYGGTDLGTVPTVENTQPKPATINIKSSANGVKGKKDNTQMRL